MGGKALGTGPISSSDIEATLQYVSPIVGIPYATERNDKGKVIRRGLEDLTLGSAAKTNAGAFGKKETVGDIDIAVDDSKYEFDQLVSRLVQRLGPENVGRPMSGMGVIPTKIPVAGDESRGYVQVDFMLGKTDLLKFTYHSPDPESFSDHNGTYRNILIVAVLQNMRRQIRDPESKEILALIGPSLLLNKGVMQQWRHFPQRKDGKGRLSTMKTISRGEFEELYPEHSGKEKEMILDNPQEIVNFLFPGSNAKLEDLDSYEKLRDLIIKYKPDQAEDIFNRFAASLTKQGLEVPKGLVVESIAKVERNRVLKEVRDISLNIVSESIVKQKNFEDFRAKCLESLPSYAQADHFTKPKANADLMPLDGLNYMINKAGLLRDWDEVNKKDYGTDYHHRVSNLSGFYTDLVEMMGPEHFFFVSEHYGLKITPESFLASLIEMEYGNE